MKYAEKAKQLATVRRHQRDLKSPGPLAAVAPYSRVPGQRRSRVGE